MNKVGRRTTALFQSISGTKKKEKIETPVAIAQDGEDGGDGEPADGTTTQVRIVVKQKDG